VRGALIAVGAIVMGYAVLGAATDPDLKPGGVLLFLAAVLVAHDAVLLPATIAGGAIIGRFAPRRVLPSIRSAAIISIAVGVVALPLVLGYGRSADNPSVLPLAYGRGLLLVIAVTWTAALVSAGLVRHRASPGTPSPEPAEEPRTPPQPAEGPRQQPAEDRQPSKDPRRPAGGPRSSPPESAINPQAAPPQPSEGQQ